jgi:hypothetical protein
MLNLHLGIIRANPFSKGEAATRSGGMLQVRLGARTPADWRYAPSCPTDDISEPVFVSDSGLRAPDFACSIGYLGFQEHLPENVRLGDIDRLD